MTSHSPTSTILTLRLAAPADAGAVAQLAELDSARVPPGPLLLAVVDGTPVAALSLQTGATVADPFTHTADQVALLRERAAQLRAAEAAPTRRRVARSAAQRLRRVRGTSVA